MTDEQHIVGKPAEWAEVPFFSCGVRAGLPEVPGDYDGGTCLIPKELAEIGTFVISVRGQSMRDFDLKEGDHLIVRQQDIAENGDIVIAMLDGNATVKAYYEDNSGTRWLIPGNPDFDPIPLTDSTARIIGVVRQIIHRAPRISLKQCAQTLRNQPTVRKAETFPLLTPAAKREGRSRYVIDQLAKAAEGSAKDLWDALHRHEIVGDIACQNLPTRELYSILKDWFNIPYGYENLRKVRP